MHVLEVKDLIRNYQKSSFKKSEDDIKVLKVLGMIDKQTDGEVLFMEQNTTDLYGDKLADIRRTQIGFIFQYFYLMDSLSVEENIMLPMILGKEKVDVMTKAAGSFY